MLILLAVLFSICLIWWVVSLALNLMGKAEIDQVFYSVIALNVINLIIQVGNLILG